MTAHWVVFAAAVLATLVAATMAAALTVFTGQALPLAVRHDLVAAQDTALSVTTLVSDPSQAAKGSAALRSQVAAAMPGRDQVKARARRRGDDADMSSDDADMRRKS